MGKFRFVIILMCILTLCASFSLQGIETGENDSTNISETTPQISEKQRQIIEVGKHIKFEMDTFFLDITLEEAKEKGVAEEIYNMWLERLKVNTQEAREVISKGGHYTYMNAYTLSREEKDFAKPYRYLKATRDSVYLTISLAEALELGISEEAYKKCAEFAKRQRPIPGTTPSTSATPQQ